ncbi:MAG: hypothetical protein JWP57_366 [Spirosoma sp.]|nr:hypothetical protein [Spirosoma sp.]
MKNLSHWASRHVSLAISLLVLGEVFNAFNGLILGAAWLDTFSVAGLHTGLVVMLCLAVGVRLMAHKGTGSFQFDRWCLFGAFMSNFLLFGLLGGLMAPRTQSPNVSVGAWGSQRKEIQTDSLNQADAKRPVRSSLNAKTVSSKDVTPSSKQTGKRIGYVLLFVLSFFLTYFMTGLACNIACSGYGFLALIVFLLGLGFLAGGIYFLGRALDNQVKKRSDMTPAERRRTGRLFWLSWLVMIGVTALFFLVSAVSG